ncbi:hypothetical protein WICPIJ_003256 [Wickerhamomyces pijperi]|uniref:ferric-chelate reductase (NADPH) n=1 Tax=Wickerhamomyces pijperi TaxID=599730 RepID=A0A9P8Q7P9_WICPI|nr:hypothetical protein WICPIJ_003256 [Wickerhamomyces pijperi]
MRIPYSVLTKNSRLSTTTTLFLLTTSIITFLPILTIAEPQHATKEQIIIYACQQGLSPYKFDCGDQSYWACACQYPPVFGSLVSCMDSYLPEDNTNIKEKAWNLLSENCRKYGDVHGVTQKLIQSVLTNSTKYLINGDDKNLRRDEINYVPILPNKEDVLGSFRDYWVFLGNLDIGQYDGFIINYYFLVVLSLCGLFYQLKRYSIIRSFHSKWLNSIRSKLSMSLIFGSHSNEFHIYKSFTTLLPSRLEFFVLLGYFTLNAHFVFFGYEIYPKNHIFGPNTTRQFLRYIADRSGIISLAHLPILVLFAGRNNLLIRLTGVNYSSFMIYHKWTARVMFFDAIIHSLAYYVLMLQNGQLSYYRSLDWFLNGVNALYLCLVIVILAIHNFRKKCYELFIVMHISLAALFFYGCYLHCKPFGWLSWVYYAAGFWISDRVLRLVNLWKFGAPMAKIHYISDQTFKVSVQRPHNWRAFPGCFVYVHFLHPRLFWQSHPFTIVDSVEGFQEVTIYIKAKEGLTKSVLDIIGIQGPYSMRVSLEGPYGIENPLKNYDNVLLIAGGNGVPGPFYHAVELAKSSLIPKRRIKLIWVIRSIDSLRWFEKALEVALDYLGYFEIEIHITSKDFQLDQIKTDPLLLKFRDFKFFKGRLNSEKVLKEELGNAVGSVAITTCGPPILCDQIRKLVANELNACPYRVDLFEELQVW